MANANKPKWNEVMNEGPKTAANENTWPTWKRVTVVLLGAFGIVALLLGAAYWIYVATYGSIDATVRDGFHSPFRMVAYASPLDPVTEYDAETLAKFEDNTLEYDEISGLVERYNPTYVKQLEQFYADPVGIGMSMNMGAAAGMGQGFDIAALSNMISVDAGGGMSRDQILALAGEMRTEARYLKDELNDNEDEMTDDQKRLYKSNISAFNGYARDLEAAAEGRTKEGGELKRALSVTKKELTQSIQNKMYEYQMLHTQNEIKQKELELAELNWGSARRQSDLGLYSPEELLAAEDAKNKASAAAHASEVALTEARRSLVMDLGWSYTSVPEIGSVPEPDFEAIAGYQPDQDVTAAIDSNHERVDIRRADKSEYGGIREKEKALQEKEDSIRMQFAFLYRDVQQKLASYHAQNHGFSAAVSAKAQADRKFSLGMLSRQEYLQAEIAWMTAQASMEQAKRDLSQSAETYEWAMRGLMVLSAGQ